MTFESTNKIVVILGPTASGKTSFSIKLAKKYNGEIVSADSRQIYKGLDIGSGKITRKEMAGIPHHLLDVANPRRTFTIAHYQKLALAAFKKIQSHRKVPFLVGGTGFYIQSVVDGIALPEVKPNIALRRQLEKKSTAELFSILKTLDPARAKTIDAKNPHRLIRAIEIVKTTGKPVPTLVRRSFSEGDVPILQIGIKKSKPELKKLIGARLKKRMKGMIAEVKKLHRDGLSWRRLEEFGLEYRYVAQYLQNKVTLHEMQAKIQVESEQFAKRQMTWFKRDKRIHWVKNYKDAEKISKKFLH